MKVRMKNKQTIYFSLLQQEGMEKHFCNAQPNQHPKHRTPN